MRDSEQGLAFGFIPYPEFRTRGKKQVSDTDKIAIFYLSGFLLPVCTAYGQAEDVFANKTEQTEQTEQIQQTEQTEQIQQTEQAEQAKQTEQEIIEIYWILISYCFSRKVTVNLDSSLKSLS